MDSISHRKHLQEVLKRKMKKMAFTRTLM